MKHKVVSQKAHENHVEIELSNGVVYNAPYKKDALGEYMDLDPCDVDMEDIKHLLN
jgi:hypothetical protein